MSRLKVTWQRPSVQSRTGWARTCIALAGGKGARAIVGEWRTEHVSLREKLAELLADRRNLEQKSAELESLSEFLKREVVR